MAQFVQHGLSSTLCLCRIRRWCTMLVTLIVLVHAEPIYRSSESVAEMAVGDALVACTLRVFGVSMFGPSEY